MANKIYYNDIVKRRFKQMMVFERQKKEKSSIKVFIIFFQLWTLLNLYSITDIILIFYLFRKTLFELN